jgi:hypothetical protein
MRRLNSGCMGVPDEFIAHTGLLCMSSAMTLFSSITSCSCIQNASVHSSLVNCCCSAERTPSCLYRDADACPGDCGSCSRKLSHVKYFNSNMSCFCLCCSWCALPNARPILLFLATECELGSHCRLQVRKHTLDGKMQLLQKLQG